MAENKIAIVLEALNKTEKAFGEVKGALNDLDKKASEATSTMSDKIANSFNSLKEKAVSAFTFIKQNWLVVTAAIAGATITIKKAFDLAIDAAKSKQAADVFRANIERMGGDAEAVFQRIRKASAGIIDDDSIIAATNRALGFGIPFEKIADLMTLARAKSREFGITTEEAFNILVEGIGRSSPLMLKQLGILTRFKEITGENTDATTIQQQQQALLNEVLEQGAGTVNKYNLEQLSAIEKAQKFEAAIENLKSKLGDSLLPALERILPVFERLIPLVEGVVGAFAKLVDLITILTPQGLSETFNEIKNIFRKQNVSVEQLSAELLQKGGLRAAHVDEKRTITPVVETEAAGGVQVGEIQANTLHIDTMPAGLVEKIEPQRLEAIGKLQPAQELKLFISMEKGSEDWFAGLALQRIMVRAESEGLKILTEVLP